MASVSVEILRPAAMKDMKDLYANPVMRALVMLALIQMNAEDANPAYGSWS